MASDATSGSSTLSGLTAAEAQEFHKFFVLGTVGFTIIACIAHGFLYLGKPWGPGAGDSASLETAVRVAGTVSGLIS